ncbi:MAG: non-homologous end-joining DNA ligase [Polyangiales bacterium]
MLATSAAKLPGGDQWTYEVKWDGYRALAVKDGNGVRLISRNQKDLTRDYPGIAKAMADLRAADVILDGEIVALDATGRPSFQALQHRRTNTLALVYYAFDLLQFDGRSVVRDTLEQRRRQLKQVLAGSQVLLSEALPGSLADIEREIRRLGLEGIVAKRRDSAYIPGERSDAWVKVKFSPQQEFVIGGYKPNATNLESILVGYYDKRKLHFAGKVRAGFTPYVRAEVMRRIAEHPTAGCPFVNLPNSTGKSHWGEGITTNDMKTLRWVKPRVVVEVGFVEWTADGLLRHSTFVGIRDDKHASDVRHEGTPATR